MSASKTISLDGVEIRLVACAHCGDLPTEADAARALKNWREAHPSRCGVCGGPVRLTSATLGHYVLEPGKEWRVHTSSWESAIDLTFLTTTSGVARHVCVHPDCLGKALPFAEGPA